MTSRLGHLVQRWFAGPALFAGLALVAAGCAVDEPHGDGHADARAADGARVIAITGKDFSFDPDRIELAAGEETAIELTAVDLGHDLVIDGVTHIHADPGERTTGGLRIDEPGTYTAYCSVQGHREAGMVATVVVTG